MQALPPALAPMAPWPQFVVWKAVPKAKKPGKLDKLPLDWRSGDVADAHNPAIWTTFEQAAAVASTYNVGYGSGVGFVFTAHDPFFFLDIDGCYDPHAYAWTPLALDLIARLPGCAVEISQSRRGLHIIGRTGKPLQHARKNTPLGIELYTEKRFVALTGDSATGDSFVDGTANLMAVIDQFFPPTVTGDWAGWTHQPVEGYNGPPLDDDLLRRAITAGQRSAAAAFGAGEVTFEDLYRGNVDKLARKWSPQNNRDMFDRSSADMALANMLAFWTGKNCERMSTIMLASALNRDKWHTRGNYLADTIMKACAFVTQTYSGGVGAEPLAPVTTTEDLQTAAAAAGRQSRDHSREFMSGLAQLDHFAGCYFENATGRVYSLPKNTEFKRTEFDVNYGGHVFLMDPLNSKQTTSAWEAFTQSRVNIPPIVDALCFRPERPSGAVITEGQRRYVNSYVPFTPHVVAGDPSKFLHHMSLLFPDETDRKKILHYMASMIQNPGRKFQWWPVIQGCEGNGKTLIGMVMTHAMGQEYTHIPNSHAMARDGLKFNSWLYRKLLIIVEEIMLAHKRDFLDEFKPVVTNERIPVEGKGKDQVNTDNRANGFLFTNHKNGVPITADQRRYSIFYTPQQSVEDLARYGMGVAYFADLLDWLKGDGAYKSGGAGYGCAVVTGYLQAYALEAEFDPARLANRAPKTTSTEEAITESYGNAEQEIIEAIEEGRVGFSGGWVSSKYLDVLLDSLRLRIPRASRRRMMQALGYDYHPALLEGRVVAAVTPDNCRPKLYVRVGHLAHNSASPVEIGRHYSRAQEQRDTPAPSAAEVAFGPR